MTIILPITKVREDLPNIVNKVKKIWSRYVVTVKGIPQAVIMSHDEYESLMETLDILSDPNAMKDIREAEADLKAGRYYDWEEVKKELGINVQNKANSKSKKRVKKSFQN